METLVQDILTVLDEKKGKDIKLIDVRDSSVMTDYMILCTGTSKTHTQALSHAVSQYVRDKDLKLYGLEGHQEGSWILVDLGSVVVHVMDELLRQYYNLESLWKNAKVVEISKT